MTTDRATQHEADKVARENSWRWFRRIPGYVKAFVLGLLLWGLATFAAWSTKDSTLVPAVIFTGSFLIPVTFVLWIIHREKKTGASPEGRRSALDTQVIFYAFFGAGLSGVVLAAVLETYLLSHHPLGFYFGVGIVEETVKIALVWLIAIGLPYYTMRDGMVLGATVGFGFAAFESAGYAFNTIVQAQAVNLSTLLQTEIVRGLLTPVGHGLWTALVAGALFAGAKNEKLRLSIGVVIWWCVAVFLHILWDMSAGVSVWLTFLVTNTPISMYAIELGKIPNPTQAQANFDLLFDWILLGTAAIVGLILARMMWHSGRAQREDDEEEQRWEEQERARWGNAPPSTT